MYFNDEIVVVVSTTEKIVTQPDDEQRISECHTQPRPRQLGCGKLSSNANLMSVT